jgi:hypothetical protein
MELSPLPHWSQSKVFGDPHIRRSRWHSFLPKNVNFRSEFISMQLGSSATGGGKPPRPTDHLCPRAPKADITLVTCPLSKNRPAVNRAACLRRGVAMRCLDRPNGSRAQRFGFGKSPRISRNSAGPLVSRRFRLSLSSTGADASPRRSISWVAILRAWEAVRLLVLCFCCALASPI